MSYTRIDLINASTYHRYTGEQIMKEGKFFHELHEFRSATIYIQCTPLMDRKQYFFSISQNTELVQGLIRFYIIYGKVYLDSIVVREELQGKGLGKALMLKFIDCCKNELMAKCIVLNAFETNEGFYEKLGFLHHDGHMRMDL
jgi:GNAT superfamily N-acetyltransferase